MRFQWPELLLLLLLVPVLVGVYLHVERRRKKGAIRYASLSLVRAAMGPGLGWRRHLPPALCLVAFMAAVLAAARPQAVVILPTNHTTLVLSMDVSRSMVATDVTPNRITAAQIAAKQFVADLPPNVRVGITSFAGTAAVVQSPTTNKDDLVAAIDRFELQRGTATGSGLLVSLAMLMPEAGIDLESAVFGADFSRLSGAIDGGPSSLERSKRAKVKKDVAPAAPGSYSGGAIILLSDGRRTTGPDPVEAAKVAADLGVKVYTVGFGSADTSKPVPTPPDFGFGGGGFSYFMRLDETALKAVAKTTAAEYFHAGTAADLRKVYESLGSKLGLERKEDEIGSLFSAGAAVLVLLAGFLSLLWFHRRA